MIMSHKEAKRFRKLNRKTSEYLVTADVKNTVHKIAISRFWWRLLAINSLIAVGILIYLLSR
jgi:hypothetical protein